MLFRDELAQLPSMVSSSKSARSADGARRKFREAAAGQLENAANASGDLLRHGRQFPAAAPEKNRKGAEKELPEKKRKEAAKKLPAASVENAGNSSSHSEESRRNNTRP